MASSCIYYTILYYAAAAAKSRQSYPTLCDPIDGSPPGSRPWDSPGKNTGVGAISFSSAWKWKVKVKSLSHVWLFETPWTVAYQAPPSMGFSRQEYWSRVPLPSPILYYTILYYTILYYKSFLWWDVFSSPLFMLKLSCLSFCSLVLTILCIIWTQTHVKHKICKYFLPFCRLSFVLLIMSFDVWKFITNEVLFSFVAHAFGIISKHPLLIHSCASF